MSVECSNHLRTVALLDKYIASHGHSFGCLNSGMLKKKPVMTL